MIAQNFARDLREDFIVKLKHDFLMTVRRMEKEEDQHASDDEVSRVAVEQQSWLTNIYRVTTSCRHYIESADIEPD